MSTTQPALVQSGESFHILSFKNRPDGSRVDEPDFVPHSVKRTSDGEVFTIGDHVTNGTQMNGNITGFSLLNGSIFVTHTWSGVGMALENISKILILPSKFQANQAVIITLPSAQWNRGWDVKLLGRIKAVHFHLNKVRYTVDILMTVDGIETSTRLQSVDEDFITAP